VAGADLSKREGQKIELRPGAAFLTWRDPTRDNNIQKLESLFQGAEQGPAEVRTLE
jgi:hypothetical protein